MDDIRGDLSVYDPNSISRMRTHHENLMNAPPMMPFRAYHSLTTIIWEVFGKSHPEESRRLAQFVESLREGRYGLSCRKRKRRY